MTIIVSNTTDPHKNIAREEELLLSTTADVLFVYINSPSVIVGRNQSIEAEVNTLFCATNSIPVIVRLSGGGSVYHDLGNINFAFITSRANGLALDIDFLTPIKQALAMLYIDVEIGSRKELLFNGQKISGTASHITKGRQLFHGTLLYDADLEMLHEVLKGDASKRGRKVASISSPVVNIKQATMRTENTNEFAELLIETLSVVLKQPQDSHAGA